MEVAAPAAVHRAARPGESPPHRRRPRRGRRSRRSRLARSSPPAAWPRPAERGSSRTGRRSTRGSFPGIDDQMRVGTAEAERADRGAARPRPVFRFGQQAQRGALQLPDRVVRAQGRGAHPGPHRAENLEQPGAPATASRWPTLDLTEPIGRSGHAAKTWPALRASTPRLPPESRWRGIRAAKRSRAAPQPRRRPAASHGPARPRPERASRRPGRRWTTPRPGSPPRWSPARIASPSRISAISTAPSPAPARRRPGGMGDCARYGSARPAPGIRCGSADRPGR